MLFFLVFLAFVSCCYGDEPIYMIHYDDLDTIPNAYGMCIPLTIEFGYNDEAKRNYTASLIMVGQLSYCRYYKDDACSQPSSPFIVVAPGAMGLDHGKEDYLNCFLSQHKLI